MAAPDSYDLSDFVGHDVSTTQAAAILSVISAPAKSYTRGEGFTAGVPNDDVRP